jgi:hypothetical protein
MSKRTVIGVALCGALVLLVGGGLYASNMGFKLNYQLQGVNTGTNTIALPWNPQVGISDAFDLIGDINSTGTPLNSVERIERWLPATNGVELYSGSVVDPTAFTLEKAVGYWVKVSADTTYVIVGSHDPGFTVSFLGTGGGGAITGTNYYAPPYHSTAADGADLINDINTNGVPPNSVERLEYWLPATNGKLLYSGAVVDPAAPVFKAGEALFVKIGVSDVSYTASHY